MYDEEDFLQLSGIQHFLFCRRQWALIHLEQQWKENYHTVVGEIMHQNAHNPELRTKRGNLLTVRGMKVHSSDLGFSGECDIVEFRKSDEGIPISISDGLWVPYPIEYKKGKVKSESYDDAQLCAQAICLEEMLCCRIDEGALFYGKDKRRHSVSFTLELRELVRKTAEEMHKYFSTGHTPKVKPTKLCKSCSLNLICLPGLKSTPDIKSYMTKMLED